MFQSRATCQHIVAAYGSRNPHTLYVLLSVTRMVKSAFVTPTPKDVQWGNLHTPFWPISIISFDTSSQVPSGFLLGRC